MRPRVSYPSTSLFLSAKLFRRKPDTSWLTTPVLDGSAGCKTHYRHQAPALGMPAQKSNSGFSAEEKAAMRERAKESRARAKASPEQGEAEVLAKLAEMPEPDRSLGRKIHAIVRATAPGLTCRTWYGMPAYAKDGEIVCFFQNGSKFKTRYATLGFSDEAHLDDGQFWPVTYALKDLRAADEAKIAALVRRAVG